jgi:hypothetical protein
MQKLPLRWLLVTYFILFMVRPLSITDVALVDGWRDNHILIFYTNIYCRYTQNIRTNYSLEDLQVAG